MSKLQSKVNSVEYKDIQAQITIFGSARLITPKKSKLLP